MAGACRESDHRRADPPAPWHQRGARRTHLATASDVPARRAHGPAHRLSITVGRFVRKNGICTRGHRRTGRDLEAFAVPQRVRGWLRPGQDLPHHGPGTTSGHGVTVHRGHVATRDGDQCGQRCRESGAQRLRERDIDCAQDVGNVARDAAASSHGRWPDPLHPIGARASAACRRCDAIRAISPGWSTGRLQAVRRRRPPRPSARWCARTAPAPPSPSTAD